MTITKHKKLVCEGCFKSGLYFQGIVHDLSKYSPSEFLVGVRYYQGTRSPIMPRGKITDTQPHGFITRDEISIITNTGSITIPGARSPVRMC